MIVVPRARSWRSWPRDDSGRRRDWFGRPAAGRYETGPANWLDATGEAVIARFPSLAREPWQSRRARRRYHPSARSLHSGFIFSISATFFARDPALICFSRAIAAAMLGVVS